MNPLTVFQLQSECINQETFYSIISTLNSSPKEPNPRLLHTRYANLQEIIHPPDRRNPQPIHPYIPRRRRPRRKRIITRHQKWRTQIRIQPQTRPQRRGPRRRLAVDEAAFGLLDCIGRAAG